MIQGFYLFIYLFVFTYSGTVFSEELNTETQIHEEAKSSNYQGISEKDPTEGWLDNEAEDLSLNQETSDMEVLWNAKFKTKMLADKSSSNTIVSTEISGELKWKFLENLFIHTKGLIVGRNGFTQFIYDRPDRSSGFHLLSAFFEWESLPQISFLVGNIQQDFLLAPLLVTDKTFPSVIAKWSLDSFSDYELQLLFQFAIPDNATEELRRETQIIKAFPLFLTSSFVLSVPDLFDISVSERFTVFRYYNLSPAVADRSRIYGNSIHRLGSDSVFEYAFFGLHNNLSAQKILSRLWAVSAGAEFIYNLMAPNTYNEGMRFYSSLYYNYGEMAEIKLTGEFFANQSDTAVSYYNSETYGHNDRKGFLAKLESHFFKSGLTFETAFVYSEPINFREKSPTGDAFSFVVAVRTNNIAI